MATLKQRWIPPAQDQKPKPPTHRCRYGPWHELPARTFKIDNLELCPRCGGKQDPLRRAA